MPRTTVKFFKDENGNIPVKTWPDEEVSRRDRRIAAKCRAMIRRLEEQGYEMRRLYADYLRDDIYELRIAFGSVNYRILYFFNDQAEAVILAHGLTKESDVPDKDINLAIKRKTLFESDVERFSHGY